MLGKLFKHELKATGGSFLLLYGIFIIVTLFNKLFLEFSVSNNRFWSSFQEWFMIFYVITCAIIFIMTAVLIVSRFYKNLMCDEGYLMFTLPVTVNQHIIVKAATAFIWMFLSILIFLTSVFTLMCGHGLGEAFQILSEFLDGQFYRFLAILILTILVGILCTILQAYVSIAIGQLVNKHRVLTSIVAYFAINFVMQNLAAFAFLISDPPDWTLPSILSEFEMMNFFYSYMETLLLISTLCNIIIGAGYFFLTSYILNKKLNLE